MSSRLFQKTLSLILLFSSFTVVSQAQDGFEIPSKWRRAGAVITDQSASYKYLLADKGKNISYEYSEKVDVMINGENGAKGFSHIYLPVGYDVDIKVSGEEDFDMDDRDAKPVHPGEKIPYFFAAMFRNHSDFERVSVGKLNKGDNISITYSHSQSESVKEFAGSDVTTSFPAQIITFPTAYPKSAHNIDITMSKALYINYGAMNGGPSASDESDMESEEVMFSIEAGQFDPIHNAHFSFPARTFPTSKFEVIYCSNPKKAADGTHFVGNPGELNEAWSEDDLRRITFNRNGSWAGHGKGVKGLEAFLGSIRSKGTDDWLAKHYMGFQSYIYCTGKEAEYSQDMFMGIMGALMDEQELDYDVICGVDKHTATFDESLLNSELVYGYRVNDRKGTFYVFPFTKYSSWNDKDSRVSGQTVFIYKHSNKLDEAKFEEDEVPAGAPAQNQKVVRSSVKLGDGFTSAIVTKSTSVLGQLKPELAAAVLTEPEYHKAILGKGEFPKWSEFRDAGDASDFKEGRTKAFEVDARALFDTVEYQRLNVKKTGFEADDPWLQIVEKYTIPEKVIKFEIKDSLRVYTVALGAFITQQYPVSIKDFQREGDIFVDFPHIIDTKLRFSVPAGYAVFGFDEFESSETYDKFFFKSTVVQKAQELIISTSLVIKSDNLDQNDWKELYAMLDKYQKLKDITITMAGN